MQTLGYHGKKCLKDVIHIFITQGFGYSPGNQPSTKALGVIMGSLVDTYSINQIFV